MTHSGPLPFDAVTRRGAEGTWDRVLAACIPSRAEATRGHLDSASVIIRERCDIFEDWSCVLHLGDRPVGIWPISFRVDQKGSAGIDAFNQPLGEPLLVPNLQPRELDQVAASAVRYVLELAALTSHQELIVRLLPTTEGSLSHVGQQLLRRATPIGCDIAIEADIAGDIESCWHKVRRSYRSPIRKAQRTYEATVHVGSDPGPLESMRLLHAEASGRETRSRQSWDEQQLAIARGEALVTLVTRAGEPVGASYVSLTGTEAFYSAGAYDRKLMADKEPIGHVAQWETIRHLSQRGAPCNYTLGWRLSGRERSTKQSAIDFFKEGFGSRMSAWPLIRVEAKAS